MALVCLKRLLRGSASLRFLREVHAVQGLGGSRVYVPRDSNIPHPEGPTYTTIMELGPQNQNRDGFFGVRVYGISGAVICAPENSRYPTHLVCGRSE